jgi:type IV secretory pathway TrbF-like protein
MTALATLLPEARNLSQADKLRLIQLLAADLADAAGRAQIVAPAARPPRFASPRLAQPDRAADFVKQVREVPTDAAV